MKWPKDESFKPGVYPYCEIFGFVSGFFVDVILLSDRCFARRRSSVWPKNKERRFRYSCEKNKVRMTVYPLNAISFDKENEILLIYPTVDREFLISMLIFCVDSYLQLELVTIIRSSFLYL